MLAFVCLAVVWACFLVPPLLRKHREGRPASSVTSFRQQLSTLERATPGTSLRLPQNRPPSVPGGSYAPQLRRSELQRRRQNILVGLGGATAFFLLLAVLATSAITLLLFVATGGALAAYVYALVQIRMRADEAASKVRVLRPQPQRRVGTPPLAVRRSASN
ncbi:MAG: hypothetical protein JWO77_3647 [Ilumatobacteraceae bacterium]|nr:hypothetical protein [Ilumatobacteraceae bacterium]